MIVASEDSAVRIIVSFADCPFHGHFEIPRHVEKLTLQILYYRVGIHIRRTIN